MGKDKDRVVYYLSAATLIILASSVIGFLLAGIEWLFHPYANFKVLFGNMFLCSIVPMSITVLIFKAMK